VNAKKKEITHFVEKDLDLFLKRLQENVQDEQQKISIKIIENL